MRNPYYFEVEPFEIHPEFGEYEFFDTELISEAWEGEVNRSNPEYIRWVQQSLNRITGLRLAEDGIMGPATRSAIRSFQRSRGLPVDGIVGPQTDRVLFAAGASLPPGALLIRRDCEVLDHFKFDRDTVRPFHRSEIIEIARRVIASQSSSRPIREIRVVGHTDTEGSASYNVKLGRRRAERVRQELAATIERMRPGLARRVKFLPAESKGETQSMATNRARRGKACNRRVEIYLNNRASSYLGCTFRCFFAEYDLRFLPDDPEIGIPANPNMTGSEKTQRTADVNAMVAALLPRRDARAADALGRAAPGPIPPAPIQAATWLSKAQLALYRECFPDSNGDINFEDLQHCFEQFANGELRDPDRPDEGGPNGGFFFLFAEFAFLCIVLGIDRAIWTKALRVFVKTQEIFMHAFRPTPASGRFPTPPAVNAPLPAICSTSRGLDDFDDSNFNQAGQSDAARKAALRAKYARMDVAALRKAAKENMLRAQCMP
jgi:flagellar motor protein MotB